MTNLSAMIAECIALKQGNKEFILSYFDHEGCSWDAGIGNPSKFVMLGESVSEISGSGETPEEAVQHLLENLKECNGLVPKPPVKSFEERLAEIEEQNRRNPNGLQFGLIRTNDIVANTITTPKIKL